MTKLPSLANLSASAFLLSALASSSFAAGLPARLTVSAGDTERIETVVEFALSDGTGKTMGLRDPQGRTIPLQVDNAGRARFVLRELSKNETRSYQIIESAPNSAGADSVSVKRVGTKLEVARADKLILAYQAEPSEVPAPNIAALYRRGGYIHPIFSPAGKLVTDDYPPDHRHHHGIWFPWTHTEIEGVAHDFWNVQDRTGNVEFAGIDRTWSGPVDGGFLSRQRHVALTGGQSKTALNETWEVRAYNTGQSSHPMWIFDFVSVQENALTVPIVLPEYYYGGLGFRGSAEWRGTNQQPYLTSEGIADKAKGNQTRGRWCFVGGPVGGQLTGVAILCHPDNFRAPQPMRLNPADPFFCYAPSQLGPWDIKPGTPYVSRYRFVVLDGAPNVAELDRLWQDYAHPPTVKLE